MSRLSSLVSKFLTRAPRTDALSPLIEGGETWFKYIQRMKKTVLKPLGGDKSRLLIYFGQADTIPFGRTSTRYMEPNVVGYVNKLGSKSYLSLRIPGEGKFDKYYHELRTSPFLHSPINLEDPMHRYLLSTMRHEMLHVAQFNNASKVPDAIPYMEPEKISKLFGKYTVYNVVGEMGYVEAGLEVLTETKAAHTLAVMYKSNKYYENMAYGIADFHGPALGKAVGPSFFGWLPKGIRMTKNTEVIPIPGVTNNMVFKLHDRAKGNYRTRKLAGSGDPKPQRQSRRMRYSK